MGEKGIEEDGNGEKGIEEGGNGRERDRGGWKWEREG